NNVLGLIIGAVASAVFLMTAEGTVSFWDCGEYIATAYKLQVGHPPGAPTFQLLGCIFSHFAGGDVTKIAVCVNSMSALCNGLCIMLLFWSITMLGKKLALRSGELNPAKMIAVFGSAVVGSLAYTFTDTFWYSGVEGEVYAMSSFCTALAFWAILKWDEVSEKNYSYRWIIFIAYVIGLSIGVHLLNLLTIPAMVLVVYFRKYKPTRKGFIYALLISFAVVGVILWGIIPGIVKYSSVFERMFTNSFGTGFYVGTIVYFLLIAGLLVWGLWYSEKKNKRLLNVGLLSLVFLLIGYSTFLILPIRSNANTPIDENNPEDAVSLLAYLNRDQYGSNPLVYGEYYNTPVTAYEDGDPVYVPKYVVESNGERITSFFEKFDAERFIKGNEAKYENMQIVERYEIGDDKQSSIRKFDGNLCTFFPRMWSSDDARVRQYRHWADITRDYDASGRPVKIEFSKNLKFFFSYQMWYMYGRYFMWNFVGRQTLDQGFGNKRTGEWVSGIKFIDEARLGPQDMPKHMQNKGNNKYYFLPFILGIIGLYFQFKHDKNNGWVVMSLFVMTGIAIGIYLNMYAYQPRERDYAFAASFYAFAIWIGFGVYAIYEWAKKYFNPTAIAAASTLICMSVPAILAAQNWDDHDRSKRLLTRDIAKSMLDNCAPNAILFTLGDNDTFPLWYLQEVEEYRTDVRICNLSLMSADWYIDQAKRKAYDGEPVPIKMTKEMYQSGTRDYMFAINKLKEPQNLKNVMQEVYKQENDIRNPMINTIHFYLDVDKEKVLKNGTVSPEDADKIVDRVVWKLPKVHQTNGVDTVVAISKAYIAMMDILAHNNWERPIYFGGTTGDETFFGLEKYFQTEGLAYRLVPVLQEEMPYGIPGRINTSILYDIMMNRYDYSQFADPTIFLSQDYTKMVHMLKMRFFSLSEALVREGKADSAIVVLDKCYQWFPYPIIPYSDIDNFIAYYAYFMSETQEGVEKGVKLYNGIIDQILLENTYYQKFRGKKAAYVERELSQNMRFLNEINRRCTMLKSNLDENLGKMLDPLIERTAIYAQ
ncbi:MAG: DUF2723 domain-containing protein, partial [Lentimicrobiaceae bacterium]|nr:DUF2723 domain-containing protein [Lentimicrobiaceae bacterium]